MLVGSDQECAGTAGGVQNLIRFMPQAKSENDINHIGIGKILPQVMPFILGDEPLKDWSNNVTELGEIILPQHIHQIFYFLDHLFLIRKGDGVNEVCGVNRLIIYFENLVEVALQGCLQPCPLGQTLRDFQRVKVAGTLSLEHIVKQDFVH
ncbi:MAG: hypothetical protein DDT25_00897 [Chloroflexi bacterium]|nr:hypothetical protein [Chloroflexota bacterium]